MFEVNTDIETHENNTEVENEDNNTDFNETDEQGQNVNIDDLMNANGIDFDNLSEVFSDLPSATSTLNSNAPTRRTSVRQAEKRARQTSSSSLSSGYTRLPAPPPSLSPIRSASPAKKTPRRQPPIPGKSPKFHPRRNPLPSSSCCGNFNSKGV